MVLVEEGGNEPENAASMSAAGRSSGVAAGAWANCGRGEGFVVRWVVRAVVVTEADCGVAARRAVGRACRRWHKLGEEFPSGLKAWNARDRIVGRWADGGG